MNICIRSAKKNDIPIILGLLYELGRPKPKTDSDVEIFINLVKKQLTDSGKSILLAENDGVDVVGMASLIFLSRLNQNNPELYIPEFIVTEKYRKNGIGTKLMNACVSLAKKNQCDKIRLESGTFRKEAHQFYKNLGFESKSLSFTMSFK